MDKKNSILEATLKLTTEVGLIGTSTALISKEANVGMGTIYRYFESKEQLLSCIFDRLSDELHQLVMSSFLFTTSPYKNFENVINNLLKYYSNNLREFKFLEIYSDSTYYIPKRLDDKLLLLEPLAKFLSGSYPNLKLKKLPIDVIFALIYGPLIAIVNLVHMKKMKLTDELISDVAKACWNSIIDN